MELAELVDYARETYGIDEEYKWEHFPGFSVLAHPQTGKWVALLMEHWDSEAGEEIEHCDIRCGFNEREKHKDKPYLHVPFRMRGSDWIGVSFDRDTEPSVVFGLLDDAVRLQESVGAPLIVLNPPESGKGQVYKDTLLPPAGPKQMAFDGMQPPAAAPVEEPIPERIQKMRAMYSYAHYSRGSKDAWNFYHQGKFMEDYEEDDQSWDFKFFEYYPVYSDFTISELRGYFSWRTHVRRGEYPPVSTSVAYVYIYELLCGIGTTSPEDTLEKLRSFEMGFLGPPDPEEDYYIRRMRRHIQQWSFEYAVIKQLPPDVVASYMSPDILARDNAIIALRQPAKSTDDEVFDALCEFTGNRLSSSAFIKKTGAEGKRLFADLWRFLVSSPHAAGQNILTQCLGRRSQRQWYPLHDAVYYEEPDTSEDSAVIEVSPVRSFRKRSELSWSETTFWNLENYTHALRELVHEADRLFRLDRKVGQPLKPNPKAAWATPRVEAFLETEHKAAAEAEKQKVRIDFSELAQIRKDAGKTRDSLLTDEERDLTPPASAPAAPPPEQKSAAAPEVPMPTETPGDAGIDELHRKILELLLEGQSAEDLIKSNHLMESVVMDTINEALFDEVGDNVLEYDGSTLSIVEDYREDITNALGGVTV